MSTSKVWVRVILILKPPQRTRASEELSLPDRRYGAATSPGPPGSRRRFPVGRTTGTTKRDLGSKPRPRALLAREMPQRPLVRHRGTTQSSVKCLQLLCPRPFPRSALARRDLDPTPSVRLLQPRATRDKPAPPPARATPETDEAAEVAAAPVFSPSPACPHPRESRCVYLAFLSPRIRVRHWVDEGQGKGAEAVTAGTEEVV